jgi:integrase
MAKAIRKSIRINGKTQNSPRFEGKDARRKASDWYADKLKEKDFIEKGLLSSSVPTFMSYAAIWIRKRMDEYPQATWAGDEQRLRKYLLPNLSEFPMDRITRTQMRELLKNAQTSEKLSIATRTRIKALASKIFSDAMNENPPLCGHNPCAKLTFGDPRQGEKLPETLEDDDEVMLFLLKANEIGPLQALACAIAVMAGLRKSEIIPLRYRHIRDKNPPSILVDCHLEQASMTIKKGTKAGSVESRTVYISDDLVALIKAYRKEANFSGEDDFIFANAKGSWIPPRKFHDLIDQVVKSFGRPITLHKLRHSYGRMAIMKGVPDKALQAQLGHSSPLTTALYSKLTGAQVATFGQAMTYRPMNKEPQQSPPKRHQIPAQKPRKPKKSK